jgi:hypothetical protein
MQTTGETSKPPLSGPTPRKKRAVPDRPVKLHSANNRETPAAALAFEMYFAMGEHRSLRKLAEERVNAETAQTGSKPSARERARALAAEEKSLFRWSGSHLWQERVEQRDREEFALRRAAERKEDIRRLRAIRRSFLTALQIDTDRLLAKIAQSTNGAPVLLSNMRDIRTAVDLLQELAGVPVGSVNDLDDDDAPVEAGNIATSNVEALRRSITRLIHRAAQ